MTSGLSRAANRVASSAIRRLGAVRSHSRELRATAVVHHGDHYHGPGDFSDRDTGFGTHAEWDRRDWASRAFTVGIGGPVGSGKTALTLQLCRSMREKYSLGVVTNDIFTREDTEFLIRNEALPAERVRAVETGGCPHAAIREDVTSNLAALEDLTASVSPAPQILLCESGGDNLAANFSNEVRARAREAPVACSLTVRMPLDSPACSPPPHRAVCAVRSSPITRSM